MIDIKNYGVYLKSGYDRISGTAGCLSVCTRGVLRGPERGAYSPN